MRCPVCSGNGHKNGDRSRDDDCTQCNGSGEVCLECGESAPNGQEFCEQHRPVKVPEHLTNPESN
jgi:DnaJ-class molecular chaperone